MTAKRIVITGVGRGLGRAMTAGFIEAGQTVCGCARRAEHVAELKARWPAPHQFAQVDVADDRQVAAWAKEVLTDGPVDLLINNAALINHNNVLWDVPAVEFDQIIDVNIKGVANVIRHFARAMVAQRQGVIVNFSSEWGRSTSPEEAPYCATKWAVEGLTMSLASELPRGMAAVPLSPGIINTNMLQTCFGSGAASYPTAEQWAVKAVPFILALGPKDSGTQLRVPQ